MKLLVVIGQLGTGGSERQLALFADALDGRGDTLTVAVWNPEPGARFAAPLAARGVRVVPLDGRGGRAGKLVRLRRLVRATGPDVVHCYSFFLNWPTQLAAAGVRAVVLGSIRGELDREIVDAGWLSGRLSARWPRRQIANNAAARRLADRGGLFAPAACAVIPNAVDVSRFRPEAPLPAEPRLLGIGSLSPVKRWDVLLDAAARLRNQGHAFTATICGEGALRPALEARIRALGLAGVVTLPGSVERVEDAIANATVVVHTARSEGCPNAVLEGMAGGRAVVATDVGDVRALMADGVTGYVTPNGDIAALAARIGELLADAERCAAFGRAGRARVEAGHAVGRMVEDMCGAYREAAASRRPRRHRARSSRIAGEESG